MKKFLLIVCLILLFIGCHFYLERPDELHIMDVLSTNDQEQFTCPLKSNTQRLVIGLPFENKKPGYHEREYPDIAGSVEILSRNNVIRTLSINKDNLQTCNWLIRQNLDGFIIGFNTPALKLTPGEKYKIRVKVSGESSLPFSLWLCYLRQ